MHLACLRSECAWPPAGHAPGQPFRIRTNLPSEPRELCQRLELRAAARRKHMPCLEPISRGEMRYRGNTKTLLKRKGTETLPSEIIAMIFRCQEEYCNDYDGDHH